MQLELFDLHGFLFSGPRGRAYSYEVFAGCEDGGRYLAIEEVGDGLCPAYRCFEGSAQAGEIKRYGWLRLFPAPLHFYWDAGHPGGTAIMPGLPEVASLPFSSGNGIFPSPGQRSVVQSGL